VRKGLPFRTGAFDVVYHSHLLEHLTRTEGTALLTECWRVLRPGGVLRVAVPDLERIATLYVDAVRDLRAGVPGARARHTWLTLELLDQVGRHQSGGQIASFLREAGEEERCVARERWGAEIEPLLQPPSAVGAPEAPIPRPWTTLAGALRAATTPERWRRAALSMIGGERWRLGDFRSSGEIHRWMYDTLSLRLALEEAGFGDVRSVSAVESAIPGWRGDTLDADRSGRPHKPDSLYIEAVKPGGALP
jgi:SAM-dependent methyltransferase